MVQRKEPEKPSSQLQPNQNHARSKKFQSSSQHRDTENREGTDLRKKKKKKKMMKEARLFAVSDLKNLEGRQDMQVKNPAPCKKPSPVRTSAEAPNFMKPSSSWDARKERLQVSVHPLTIADKNQRSSEKISVPSRADKKQRSSQKTSNLNSLKFSYSASPALKPTKVLTRKSSLKRVETLIKKSPAMLLFHKFNASRSTCSSTLKDSKFPNALELCPGGTELEGTSVMKVCPYTYCSLNGHKHEPLPPLKCFLSARRQLLKTQKSMRLKGPSPRRGKVMEKGKEEIDIGEPVVDSVPSTQGVSPMIEEVSDDFFVEIYDNSQADLLNSQISIQEEYGAVDLGAVVLETSTDTSLLADVKNSTETEIEGNKREIKTSIDASCSKISSESNLNEKSDLSALGMDVLTTAIEYVKCHRQAELPQDTKDPPCFAQDYVEWSSQECCSVSASDEAIDSDVESKSNGRTEAAEMDCEEDLTKCTDNSDNKSEPCPDSLLGDTNTDGYLFLQAGNNVTTRGKNSLDTSEPNDRGKDLEFVRVIEASTIPNSQLQNKPTDNSDQNAKSLESDEGCDLKVDSNKPNRTDDILDSEDGMFEEPTEVRNPKSKNFLGQFLLGEDTNEDVVWVFSDQAPESLDTETRGNMEASKESLEDNLLGSHIEGDNVNKTECLKEIQEHKLKDYHQGLCDTENNIKSQMKLEDCLYNATNEDRSLPSEIPICSLDAQSDQCNTEKIQKRSEDNWGKEITEIEPTKSTSNLEDETEISSRIHIGDAEQPDEDEICPAESCKCLKEDKAIICAPSNMDQLQPKPSSDPNTRWCAQKNRADMDLEELKPFNPRPPNFLPIELDPDAEKVDLKHQTMDERKNAEDWMMDYALQRAVTKLAPARRKKVALLVEAFETVLPLPAYEKPLRPATVGFRHARPVQACS